MKMQDLEKELGFEFANKKLLQEALTHPSKKLENRSIATYQRLEFLGDKVLNFVIASYLFEQFPSETEGEISRRHAHLVCGEVCYGVAKKIDVFPFVLFSNAQKNDASCNELKIGEDVIEAIIGAMFLDGGLAKVQNFIKKQWKEFVLQSVNPPKDAKSALQEYFQKHFGFVPNYEVFQRQNKFVAEILLNGTKFSASSSTKKEAEKFVAKKALNSLL